MNTPSIKDSSANRSASSNSVFSRITSPFSSKNRSFADFDIHLDEPLREYRAGDIIKGSIQLAVPKPLRITHLVLSLHGYAKVYKTAAAPGEGLPAEVKLPTPGRGKSGVEYLGNGLVSLFEDETILCGSGKLNLGKYSFRFETQFPARSLPSSLSFERGTICYVLVATLTRPTSITPTMSKDKSIPFRETLDTAFEPKPKPRKLHLKALNRSRHRPQPKRSLTDRTTDSASNTNQSSTGSSDPVLEDRAPDCNASERSNDTGRESTTFQTVHTPSRVTLSIEIPTTPTQSSKETISATVDVLKGGFLPGDYVPVRISIKHTKSIRSMQGIIVTLYRKAKIDSHPLIDDGKSSITESLMPKSRTGLSGLTLTGHKSHLYRMDLAQTFAPMVVNPLTLEADIKTAVKIPEDVFPTVKSVPGQMIVFTYHVEVVMDLGGKLSNQDRIFSRMNMTKNSPSFSVGANSSGAENGLPSSMEMYHLIDTSEIKREKGVAYETIEVLIGSHDSKRKANDKKKIDLWLQDDTVSNFSGPEETPSEGQAPLRSPSYTPILAYEDPRTPTSPSPPQFRSSDYPQPTDEKSRLRLAEQRLLPSAPPQAEGFASGSMALPSAPHLSDLESFHPANHVTGAPDFENLGFHGEDDIAPAYQREFLGSGATVAASGADGFHSTSQHVNEDKAELERQRLLALASSPDERDEDGLIASSSHDAAPSAPVLDETYERSNITEANGSFLPLYDTGNR